MKICFCFPYKHTGGVSDLFVLLAKALHARGYDVSYVDYRNGAMHKRLALLNDINLLEYDERDRKTLIDSDVIILQSTVPWTIYSNLEVSNNTKVIFWNCHPENLILRIPSWVTKYTSKKFVRNMNMLLFPNLSKKLRNFITFCMKMNALVFMDGENVKHTFWSNNLALPSDIRYLPIPVSINTSFSNRTTIDPPFDFYWAGRVVASKCYTLISFARALDQYGSVNNEAYSFKIVGEGPFLHELKSEIRKLKNIKATFLAFMQFEELIESIQSDAKVFLASGTLSLIGGSLRVPTLLLDIANYEVSQNKFNFIYETQNFSLGAVLDRGFIDDTYSWTMHELMKRVKDLDERRILADRCYDYVVEHHDLDRIVHLFVDSFSRSELTWENLKSKGFLERSLFYEVLAKIKGIAI